MNSVGMSKIGLVRQRNEDRFFIEGPICAVTDGMGGYKGGEIASTYAVDAIENYLKKQTTFNETVLKEAIEKANTKIIDRVAQEPSLTGMGTTAVVVATDEHVLWWASVGDSRLYIFRHGSLRQITTDHSMVQELYAVGDITKEEMISHPKRNLLTRAVGIGLTLHIDSGKENIEPGDRILLCTDGLTGYVRDEEIEGLLESISDNTQAVETLMNKVYDLGASDNVTIVVGTV